MSIAAQISQNLVNPEEHSLILNALIAILEEEGEIGLKSQIAQWINEIKEELPDEEGSEA